ncbi:MAG: DMT family transporter [Hyphomicrobiaceae bacterium]
MAADGTANARVPVSWTADRVVKGIALMLLAGICSSLLHIGVRTLSPYLPAIEIVALRSTFTLLVAAPVFIYLAGANWTTRRFDLHVVRGLIGVFSMWTWYHALGNLPLADAGALSFTTGLFVTVGAALFFREAVGLRRWAAVAVGFLGAMIILKPGLGIVSWPALWAVFSSALWAVSLLMSKQLAKYDSSLTISFFQPLVTAPIALLLALPGWVWPAADVLAILFGMGIVAAVGNYCYVHAMRIADASLVMPADYVRLIWMAGWGFLFFAEIPRISTWIGAALIVGSTLFITWREAHLAAQRRAAAAIVNA